MKLTFTWPITLNKTQKACEHFTRDYIEEKLSACMNYKSVPMNVTLASAFITTDISNFSHLNKNPSNQVSMHSLCAIDSKDLINLDEQDSNII